ncbi:MAG TPA: LysR substrate-binding domain-containing protein [Bryobacteraceae bacterium]|jgi:LysR family hca operon transcriptional activator|nr:LysR substrate-binding domain-containing protein [Bryobacteraceae bacterium]
MELRHLRYFVAVAEELNFTRAAQRLNTAQPSLSQQIKQLEANIGVPLLERSKRQVALTEGGKVFLVEAREILARVERAGQRAARAQQGKSTELIVGVVPAAEIKILPKLIPLLERSLPKVRLVFHNLPSAEQKRLLARGSLDFGLLRGPFEDPRLEVEDVLWEKLVAGLPAKHHLARKKTVSIRQLNQVPFIMVSREGSPELHDAVRAFCERSGLHPREAQQADNILGNLNMIRAGIGFALLPDYAASILPRGVVVKPLAWTSAPVVSLVMAHRRGKATAEMLAFRELMRDCFPA